VCSSHEIYAAPTRKANITGAIRRARTCRNMTRARPRNQTIARRKRGNIVVVEYDSKTDTTATMKVDGGPIARLTLSGVAFVASTTAACCFSTVWSYWYFELDADCPDRADCRCVLFGTSLADGFVGGERFACRYVLCSTLVSAALATVATTYYGCKWLLCRCPADDDDDRRFRRHVRTPSRPPSRPPSLGQPDDDDDDGTDKKLRYLLSSVLGNSVYNTFHGIHWVK